MKNRELPETLLIQMRRLCDEGDLLVERREFDKAYSFYQDALRLIPQPLENWEATTWILAAIGDLYFRAGRFEKAAQAFQDALGCPNGLGNPFIHLRLGESYFELISKEQAANELARAYMAAGKEVFGEEDPKYLIFLRTKLQPPEGQTEL